MTGTPGKAGEGAVRTAMDNGTGGQPTPVIMQPPAAMPMDARSIKAALFTHENKHAKRKVIKFYGQNIELRQPSLREAILEGKQSSIDTADMSDVEKQVYTAMTTIINHAYVPGTNDKMFDESDREQLLSLPWDGNYINVINAYNKLVSSGVDEEVKN